MLKNVSTWIKSHVLHESSVAVQADVAQERWGDVPFILPSAPAPSDPQANRKRTPPPLPPKKTTSRLATVGGEAPAAAVTLPPPPEGASEWQDDLLALAKSTVEHK